MGERERERERGRGNSLVVEVTRMGGTGGCMFGGSEDDLCLPDRSLEPGFHPDVTVCTRPPITASCPGGGERERERERERDGEGGERKTEREG